MASPIGHAIAGYAVHEFGRSPAERLDPTFLVLTLLMAVAPDFDFLPGILQGQPALYHQGITHSLGFAAAVSLAAALLYSREKGRVLFAWRILFLSYSTHMLIDLFGPDKRPPIGVPLFWPFSDATYLSPVQLLMGISHAKSTSVKTGEWLATIFQWRNAAAIGLECIATLPFVGLARRRGRRRAAAGRSGGQR